MKLGIQIYQISIIPGNSIETGADREISIYLNDLDPDKAIDLYVRF